MSLTRDLNELKSSYILHLKNLILLITNECAINIVDNGIIQYFILLYLIGQIPQKYKSNSNDFEDLKKLIINNKNIANNKKILSIRFLEIDRLNVYSQIYDEQISEKIKRAKYILCISHLHSNTIKEKIAIFNMNDNKINEIQMLEQMCYEDLSLSEFVEYKYDKNDEWLLSFASLDTIKQLKKEQFGSSLHVLRNCVDTSSVGWILHSKIPTHISDRYLFPSFGHITNPRMRKQVYSLRTWCCKTRKYIEIDTHLDGAPLDHEFETYWSKIMNEFYERYGKQEVNRRIKNAIEFYDKTAEI